jgi:hypothetical protein
MPSPAGSTSICVQNDGRAAAEKLAVMFMVHLGKDKRMSLNDALVEAERVVRSVLGDVVLVPMEVDA